MSTILLTRQDVSHLISVPDTIRAVEQAFSDYALRRTVMPPKVYLNVAKGDFRAMPAYIPGAAGIKWVNVHPGNILLGLPSIMAIIIYSDPDTGYPLAIMDGTEITAYRTGAASAVASKHLATKGAVTFGLIGAGRQAYAQISAHTELFHFSDIRVHDVDPVAATRLVQAFPGYPVRVTSLMEASGSDIVSTLTPSRAPVLLKEWLKPGAHINAVGADAPGKQELEPSILDEALVVVDDHVQATHAGEINVPIAQGKFREEQIYGTLGEITSGQKPGRTNDIQITVFDSTGLAIQDIAVAKGIYRLAKAKQVGFQVNLVN